MNSSPRLLVVDDEPHLCANLKKWLTHCGYAVDTAGSTVEAMALARERRPEVVITDLRMPGLDGHGLLALMKELDPAIEVIILTGDATLEDAIAALSEGRAFQFLTKPLKDPHVLALTVEKALLSRTRRLAAPGAAALDERLSQVAATLSERERALLSLLAKGMDNEAIADKLCLSVKTVRNGLSQVYHKLGVQNRTQAVVLVQQLGVSLPVQP